MDGARQLRRLDLLPDLLVVLDPVLIAVGVDEPQSGVHSALIALGRKSRLSVKHE